MPGGREKNGTTIDGTIIIVVRVKSEGKRNENNGFKINRKKKKTINNNNNNNNTTAATNGPVR